MAVDAQLVQLGDEVAAVREQLETVGEAKKIELAEVTRLEGELSFVKSAIARLPKPLPKGDRSSALYPSDSGEHGGAVEADHGVNVHGEEQQEDRGEDQNLASLRASSGSRKLRSGAGSCVEVDDLEMEKCGSKALASEAEWVLRESSALEAIQAELKSLRRSINTTSLKVPMSLSLTTAGRWLHLYFS